MRSRPGVFALRHRIPPPPRCSWPKTGHSGKLHTWCGELTQEGLCRNIRMPHFAHRLQFHFYEQETLGTLRVIAGCFSDRLCARDQARSRETSSAEIAKPNSEAVLRRIFWRAETGMPRARSGVLSSTERSLFPTDVLHSGSAKCLRRYCENWGREGALVLQQVQRLRGS